MNFHCMKRKQLQALCKQHRIPANLSNLDMANKLTEFLREKENPVIKEQEGILSETESINVVANREVKKVRFSPEHDLIEFTRSPEMKRSRRNSVCRKDCNLSVEIVENGEINKETVCGRPRGRPKRTGELKLMEAGVNQKKRGMKALNCNSGKTIASDVDIIDDGKSEVRSGRVTRLRGKMPAEGVKNASKREGEEANDDGIIDEKASDNVHNEKEIVDNRSRITRSRAQKLTEAPTEEEKRGRKVAKNIGKAAAVRAETDSSSKRGDEGEGKSDTGEKIKGNGKELEEILVNKQIAGEHEMVEPQVLLRRSKRKVNMVGDSEMLTTDKKKHEDGEIKVSRKTSKPLASDVFQVDAEIIGSEVNPGRRAVLEIEEPIKKVEPRRSNRRKTMIESDDLRAENENICPVRRSVPQSDIVPEVTEDEKMILHPIGVLRRSRRKTLGPKLISATNDTDSAVENAEKLVSEQCLVEKERSAVQKNTRSRRNTSKCKPPELLDKIGGDSNIQQKNKLMKRKRGHVSGDVIKDNNDINSGAQSMKGRSSEKVVSSHHGSSGIGESLSLDVQLSVSKDSESASNLCSKNIISDVELTSIRNTDRKKEDVSNADSAGSSCMNLTNGEELANSDTNIASKIAQLETDSTVAEDQNYTSNSGEVEKGNSLLEINGQESFVQNVIDADKNDPEAQVYSQMEDSGCNNKINDQVLAEGLDVSGEEGSAEASSSADSLLLGDQTDVKTDLKVAETEADECLQSCPGVVDHHNDLDHLEASSNILDKYNNNEDTSQTAGEVGALESYETDFTHSKSTLQLKAPSSGMARHLGGDTVAEGNETFFPKCIAAELAETDEDGCSKDLRKSINHSSEFDMPDVSNGERDARIVSQDRGTFPSEYSVMNTDKKHEVFQAVGPTTICTNSADVNLKRGHEDDHQRTKREEIYIDEGINSEASEIREGKSYMGHKSKCDGDGEFSLANLFDEEGRYGITPQDKENFSGEHSVKDFNEQGMLHGSPFVEPTSTCNSTGDHEANLSAEGGETHNYKDKQSELTEAGKSGCLKSNASSKDEDWELSGFNLFDEEKSTRIKPQDRVVSAKYSIKDLNEVEIFPDLPVASTTCVNYNEVRESSISQETNPSTPSSVSETQAEQQKTPLAKLKVANTNQMQEAWSNASVLAGNAVLSLKSYAEGEISQVAEGLSADEDVNHAKYGLDKEGSAEECISDVKGCTISKIAAESLNDIKFQDSVETEQQHVNLLAGRTESDAGEEATQAISRQSWTEIELHNLFGTTLDEDAPPVLGDTFCQGTEIANMTTSTNKSTAKNSGSLTKKKGTEMEGENRNEGAKTKNKNVVLPTGFSDDNDIDENQLKFLFATPDKIITPNKIEESVTSIKGCSSTMKENVATESTSTEKAQNAGYEVDNNLCIGASLSDNGGDDICEEMSEVESFELLNTSTRILSGAGYDGCETLEDQLTQNKEEECLKGTNLTTEEDEGHVILPAQSCLHDEATEKDIISSSDTQMSETLGCQSEAHNKSEEEMEQSAETVFELSDADLQKSDVPENSHLLTVGSDDGNILREASIETSSDPEVAKNGSFQKDVAEKGIYPILDCDSIRESDDQYEGADKDVKDIYGELHTNSEVAIKKSVSIGYNLSQELDQLPSYDELESTCKEAKGMGTTLVDLLPDIGGDDTCEKINNVESVELKDTSTTPLSKTENGGCEASEERLTENTGDSQKETNFITEDKEEKVFPLGQSHLSDEGTDNNSESTEENIVSLSGSPNNLDRVEGCQDMLIDTSLSESLKSQQEMAQSSEAALELSDAYLQNSSVSKNSRLTACFEDDNISKEASLKTSSGLLVAELSITGIFDGQNARDEGTSVHHSLKASSPVDDELTKEKDTDELNEANNTCDEIDAKAKSSQYMSDELHMNSDMAISKSVTDSDNPCEEEADKLPCSLELGSMFLEAKEAGTTGQDPNNIVAPAGHGSSVCGAASSIENLDAVMPVVFNLNGDNEKNSEKAEDKKSAQMVQFSIQEVHFEENVQDDAHIVSNSPASEILKESDVADTIREYIDSESSLSVIFENSTASLPSDVSIHEDDIEGRLGNSNDEDNMTEIKEPEEATLFMEPAQVSRPGCVAFLAEGTCVEVDSQKKLESADVELSSTTRKNAARTILIHGTPGKLVTMADMKENAETQQKKRSNMGDITAVRPAKRRALQDLKWK